MKLSRVRKAPGSRKKRWKESVFGGLIRAKFYQKKGSFEHLIIHSAKLFFFFFFHMFFNPLKREVSGFYQVGALLEDNPLIFFSFLLYYLVSCSLCIIILSFGGLYV